MGWGLFGQRAGTQCRVGKVQSSQVGTETTMASAQAVDNSGLFKRGSIFHEVGGESDDAIPIPTTLRGCSPPERRCVQMGSDVSPYSLLLHNTV